MDLFAWYNLIFLLPLVAGILMVLGSAMGLGGGDTPSEADHDFGHDGVGHNAGHDHDGKAVHLHGEVHADHDPGILMRMFSLLGIGRVPLSVVLMSWFLLYGTFGMMGNFILKPVLATEWLYFWPSFAGAAFLSVFLTSALARVMQRVMPTSETYVLGKRSLVGRIGTLILDATETRGTAQVRDARGDLHQIACVSRSDRIPSGTDVLLVDYRSDDDTFIIEPNPLVTRPAA